MPTFAVLGIRVPVSALHLPPAIKPRCGHLEAKDKFQCPMCGLASDVDPAVHPISGFDGKFLHGYGVVKAKDEYFIGIIVGGGPAKHGVGYSLTVEGFAEFRIKMRDRLIMTGAWTDNFGMWCVEGEQP
jgi:hypothetical protein